MEVLGGTAFIKADGIDLVLAAELTVCVDTVERETQDGLNGPAGVTQKRKAAWVEGTAYAAKDTPIDKINGIVNGTVSVEFDNGRKFLLQGAASVKRAEINADNGQFGFRFEGKNGRYLK